MNMGVDKNIIMDPDVVSHATSSGAKDQEIEQCENSAHSVARASEDVVRLEEEDTIYSGQLGVESFTGMVNGVPMYIVVEEKPWNPDWYIPCEKYDTWADRCIDTPEEYWERLYAHTANLYPLPGSYGTTSHQLIEDVAKRYDQDPYE